MVRGCGRADGRDVHAMFMKPFGDAATAATAATGQTRQRRCRQTPRPAAGAPRQIMPSSESQYWAGASNLSSSLSSLSSLSSSGEAEEAAAAALPEEAAEEAAVAAAVAVEKAAASEDASSRLATLLSTQPLSPPTSVAIPPSPPPPPASRPSAHLIICRFAVPLAQKESQVTKRENARTRFRASGKLSILIKGPPHIR